MGIRESPHPELYAQHAAITHRIKWLDSLRGLAAMAVVLQHYFLAMATVNPAFDYCGNVLNRYDFGVFGVAIFFFISGYVIPASANRNSSHPVLGFWAGRVFRLFPAYWLSVILASTIAPVGLSTATKIINFTMLQRFMGVPDALGVYWTLQVELSFYVIVSALIFFRCLNSEKVPVWGEVVALLVSAAFAFVRFHSDKKTPLAVPIGWCLMFAGNFYYWAKEKRSYNKRFVILFFAAFAIGLVCIVELGYRKDWGHKEYPSKFIVIYGVATFVFLLAGQMGWTARVFEFLGTISYSIYLLHEVVNRLITFHGTTVVGGAVQIVLAVSATLLLATAMYYTVERPMINVGRSWVRKHTGAKALSPLATPL